MCFFTSPLSCRSLYTHHPDQALKSTGSTWRADKTIIEQRSREETATFSCIVRLTSENGLMDSSEFETWSLKNSELPSFPDSDLMVLTSLI